MKKISFQIRNDVKWNHGAFFTIDDAIFSIKITACPLVNNVSYNSAILQSAIIFIKILFMKIRFM